MISSMLAVVLMFITSIVALVLDYDGKEKPASYMASASVGCIVFLIIQFILNFKVSSIIIIILLLYGLYLMGNIALKYKRNA